MKERPLNKGLVIIFTGDGKGKSSAALGIAFRALGHKLFVSLVQFIKSPSETGEARAAERFAPQLEFVSLGRGFVTGPRNRLSLSHHRKAAEKALDLARQRMLSGSWDILILDEINNAVHLGLLDVKDVLDLVKNKPPKLHMILTGRNAPPELIAAADLVTEMRVIKHPYDAGVAAQMGIDY